MPCPDLAIIVLSFDYNVPDSVNLPRVNITPPPVLQSPPRVNSQFVSHLVIIPMQQLFGDGVQHVESMEDGW
jgi:hypothetical protein